MLMLRLMNFLYLDNYRNLWDKYHDPYREIYSRQRAWAYKRYKIYFDRAFKEHDLTTCILMRKFKRAGDYKRLFNIMLDMDNDFKNMIPESNM